MKGQRSLNRSAMEVPVCAGLLARAPPFHNMHESHSKPSALSPHLVRSQVVGVGSSSSKEEPEEGSALEYQQQVLTDFLRDLSFWENHSNTSSNYPSRDSSTMEATAIRTNSSPQHLYHRNLQQYEHPPSSLTQHTTTIGGAPFYDEYSGTNSVHPNEDYEEKKVEQPRRLWKSAVDPATGRTYYYDAVTRQTQWEKPDEIRAEERRARKEKRRLDQLFFDQVRKNVLASVERGELIPGIPREQTTKQGPPQEPFVSSNSNSTNDLTTGASPASVTAIQAQQRHAVPTKQPPSRIRTISGMNEKLLAELHKNTTGSNNHSNNNSSNSRSNALGPLRTNTVTNQHPAQSSAPLVEGRPPLPQRGRSLGSSSGLTSTSAAGLSIPMNPHDFFAPQDSMEVSPDLNGKTYDPNSGMTVIPIQDSDLLQGEHLLDGPIWGNSLSSAGLSDNMARQWTQQPQRPEAQPPQQPHVTPQPPGASNSLTPSPAHVRRNTGGTVFVKSTMENPDIDATIKCVCGVYRAHIVQAASRPPGDQSSSAFDVFRDEVPQYRVSRNNSLQSWTVPSLVDIQSFYHDFYRRSQMEHDTIIMSLIYVERLIKETNGALTPAPHNWKSVLFSCMVLSSKVWDDLSMFNLDFSNVSMSCGNSSSGLSAFSLQRTNALEVAVLQTLNFNVRVAASEYAKYYFLIRTMLIRSGLLDERISPGDPPKATPADALPAASGNLNSNNEGGQRLEHRTSQYQDSLKRRAKSVDWTFGASSAVTEPVLQDSVCLEQLLLRQQR